MIFTLLLSALIYIKPLDQSEIKIKYPIKLWVMYNV